MSQTKIVSGHCKIKDKNVNLTKEAISEHGREGIMSWRVKKCLDKDRTCEELGCIYAPRGIGDAGTQDPFN